MILTGGSIQDAVRQREIKISPFEPTRLGPNSYDFHLGTKCRTYDSPAFDGSRPHLGIVDGVPPTVLTLDPKRIYLWDTRETIGSSRYVPIIRARSSNACPGLFVHVVADLIDIGSVNHLTPQLLAVAPINVYPMMKIDQVTFWVCSNQMVHYSGEYHGIESPAGSPSYRGFGMNQ
jgi:dCTP deaminase